MSVAHLDKASNGVADDDQPRSQLKSEMQGRGRSLTDIAYEEIKRRIITLTYQPSSYLNEAQLCDDLGIGRTPVHQAVNRLALEGMINIIPRKGIIVSPISLDDAMAVFEVRLMVEPACARLAAERASAKELQEMQDLLLQANALMEQRDIEGLMQIDRSFHSLIAHSSKNKVLEQILLRLHERSLRFWFISLSDKVHVSMVSHQHQDIINKLVERDADGVEHLVKAHIEAARDRIRMSA